MQQTRVSGDKFNAAVQAKNWKALMVFAKKGLTLRLRRLSAAQRSTLIKEWRRPLSPAPQFQHIVDFRGIPRGERQAMASALFRGDSRNPLTREAWAAAALARTATVKLNFIQYPTRTGSVSYVNTPAGTIRTTVDGSTTVRHHVNYRTGQVEQMR